MEESARPVTIESILGELRSKSQQFPSESSQQLIGLLDEIEAEINNMKDALIDKLKQALQNVLSDMNNSDAEPSNISFPFRIFRSSSSGNRLLDVIQKQNKVIEVLKRVARLAKYSFPEKKLKELDPELMKRLEELMVGREKEKEEIIDQLVLLSRTKSPVPVITIVGIAGIGKTKLARLIYQDEKVKNQLGLPAWVGGDIINNTFDADSIAKQVIADIKKPSLTKNLNVFVVLDDLKVEIGHKGVEALKLKLERAGLSLMAMVITTRSFHVARDIAAKSYALPGVNEEDSLSLFQKIPGGDNSSITVTEEMRRKIVAQCRGVPLAIITMARLLHSHRSQLTELTEDFLMELTFSYYDHLPDNCKLCFAYCSLFPGDYVIDAERLIHLWMAEGFLESSTSTRPEEIGASCLRDFIRSSIFQDIEDDEFGVVISCRMHPLMHDIARFVTEQDPTVQKVTKNCLRASFDLNSLDFSRGIPAPLLDKAEEYITILSFAKAQTGLQLQVEMSTPILENIFKSFKNLCVLDLRDLGITTVPKSIGELNYLNYLDLSLNNMEKLPSSITKLSELQTLKLSSCYWLKELPKDFAKLAKLKHLDTDGCLALTHMPRNLNSLHTVSAFVASKNDGLGELASLNQLEGHLEILHLDRIQSVPSKVAYLAEKKNLQRLTLRWDPEVEQVKGEHHQSLLDCLKPHSELKVLILVGYKGLSIPSSWLTSLGCLVKLSLSDCPGCKFLVKDQLPKLKILQLVRLDNLEYIIETDRDQSAGFYSTLEELTISDCPKLKSWWQREKAVKDRPSFDSISKLQVHHCPILTSMPLFRVVDKELVLEDSSLELLQDTISYSESHGLPKLKSMVISGVTKHHDTLEKWLGDFVSLENLHIQNCDHLRNLSDGFQHLSSLQRLTIENCPEINLDGSSNEWKGLKNLRFLTIREIPILMSLSFGDSVSSLRELALHNCHGLTCISESIGKVTSLRRLVISKCRVLGSLPKAMEDLKSLETLIILDCPKLLPRCQPETGDYWPQIRRIKHIQVK